MFASLKAKSFKDFGQMGINLLKANISEFSVSKEL